MKVEKGDLEFGFENGNWNLRVERGPKNPPSFGGITVRIASLWGLSILCADCRLLICDTNTIESNFERPGTETLHGDYLPTSYLLSSSSRKKLLQQQQSSIRRSSNKDNLQWRSSILPWLKLLSFWSTSSWQQQVSHANKLNCRKKLLTLDSHDRHGLILMQTHDIVSARQTNSAHFRAKENDGSASLVDTLNEASASFIQPSKTLLTIFVIENCVTGLIHSLNTTCQTRET